MIIDMMFEHERCIVYDRHTGEMFQIVWNTLVKTDFLVAEFYQDSNHDDFWLFSKGCSRTLLWKSTSLNALFLYMDKASEIEYLRCLIEQCPLCASKQIESYVHAAYDRAGIPAPSSHCIACKMRWHDSKTFKAFFERVFASNE